MEICQRGDAHDTSGHQKEDFKSCAKAVPRLWPSSKLAVNLLGGTRGGVQWVC
jgi:hypothetical protein